MTTSTSKLGMLADVTEAIADAIRSAGADGLISGHIFAAICGKVSYSDYTGIIHMLKDIGLVSESGFVIRWIGGGQ